MRTSFHRVKAAFLTLPRAGDWLQAVGLLLTFTLVYLPIGFTLGFLKIDARLSWPTILSVMAGAFIMPSVPEELGFRVLLIPHPTELISPATRWFLSGLSLLLFVAYHIHPFVPSFFRRLPFC
ncbi:MAG: CPBP family glutamic-type intramembrane protease [Leptolyngbya sp. BL-A-14]